MALGKDTHKTAIIACGQIAQSIMRDARDAGISGQENHSADLWALAKAWARMEGALERGDPQEARGIYDAMGSYGQGYGVEKARKDERQALGYVLGLGEAA